MCAASPNPRNPERSKKSEQNKPLSSLWSPVGGLHFNLLAPQLTAARGESCGTQRLRQRRSRTPTRSTQVAWTPAKWIPPIHTDAVSKGPFRQRQHELGVLGGRRQRELGVLGGRSTTSPGEGCISLCQGVGPSRDDRFVPFPVAIWLSPLSPKLCSYPPSSQRQQGPRALPSSTGVLHASRHPAVMSPEQGGTSQQGNPPGRTQTEPPECCPAP